MIQRQRTRLATRMKLKQVVWVSSLLIVFLTSGFFFFFNLAPAKKVFGAANGDYRSKASGNWNSSSTWETFNGSNWVTASAAPSNNDGFINIRSGHTVTVNSSVNADQLTIDSGGVLNASSNTLTIKDGAGNDLTVNGTLNIGGAVNSRNKRGGPSRQAMTVDSSPIGQRPPSRIRSIASDDPRRHGRR